MKTNRIFSIFILGVILIFTLNCKINYAQENYSQELAIKMLENFYTSYITVIISPKQPKYSKLDSIERVYCTSNYFKEIRKYQKKLDYNPFLKAQDSNIECLRTLSIRKDSERNDLYFVTYFAPYEKIQVTIKLTVVKEKDCYKIDCVYLDDLKIECPCKKEKNEAQ